MNDTRSEIIRLANELIRSVGYNAFSYADISKQLNIKNAAVHYYFPSKSDLGIAVIKESHSLFLEKTEAWSKLNCKQQYKKYITMHDSFVKTHWTCIVGSLAPSFDTLPENMQKELQKLVNTILDWLTELLTKGKETEVFNFKETPRTRANMIHSTLLSSLQMNKVLRNDIYKSIQEGLLNI
ncbi:TetR/AcrR family transcriptional regulator [Dysgonomonas sp. BGC7]|uniref:TetR/AcrR family transcriptional regulator n=1 Tax=Dysgonomonas sp. BGC7 TaxID=1658008 RepID=UPI0006831F11|nr:TetR/AcrR family transcriptional regulator [Dysgonomonas sp. BGC7]MBD8387122.1 TetR/AcrR family transcriptional regulator [Dysgonomonas sp. BGC7]